MRHSYESLTCPVKRTIIGATSKFGSGIKIGREGDLDSNTPQDHTKKKILM